MSLSYRVAPLPDPWPGKPTPSYARKRSPFDANWGGTLELLAREIRHLNGKDVIFALGVDQRHIRNDGGVRADARIPAPVIVGFRSGPDLLSFPCDRFDNWQDNVRAIALALEALRKVDRYGVQSGKQYQGFKSLPGSGGAAVTMSSSAAAELLSSYCSVPSAPPGAILKSAELAKAAYRTAASRAHPDSGGSTEAFQSVQAARGVLSAHHGVSI